MLGRVVEINEDGRHLSVYRGFMRVTQDKEEIARIALDEIAVILAHAYQLTFSNQLLLECCKRGIAFVFTASNHLPAGMLWPAEQHHAQSGIMRDQLNASQPLCKQLWKSLIKAKITFQAEQLALLRKEDAGLLALASRVKSGDPDNIEAQAARRYWPQMMGQGFSRNQDSGDTMNAMLNYGYAILRSAAARAIMSAGLHPALGIFHRNRLNTMCLVDDMMEPFRPKVDALVCKLLANGATKLSKEEKTMLAGIHLQDVTLSSQATPLGMALARAATSLAESYQQQRNVILLPESLHSPLQGQLLS